MFPRRVSLLGMAELNFAISDRASQDGRLINISFVGFCVIVVLLAALVFKSNRIYTLYSGFIHPQWGNCVIGSELLKQPQGLWVMSIGNVCIMIEFIAGIATLMWQRETWIEHHRLFNVYAHSVERVKHTYVFYIHMFMFYIYIYIYIYIYTCIWISPNTKNKAVANTKSFAHKTYVSPICHMKYTIRENNFIESFDRFLW